MSTIYIIIWIITIIISGKILLNGMNFATLILPNSGYKIKKHILDDAIDCINQEHQKKLLLNCLRSLFILIPGINLGYVLITNNLDKKELLNYPLVKSNLIKLTSKEKHDYNTCSNKMDKFEYFNTLTKELDKSKMTIILNTTNFNKISLEEIKKIASLTKYPYQLAMINHYPSVIIGVENRSDTIYNFQLQVNNELITPTFYPMQMQIKEKNSPMFYVYITNTESINIKLLHSYYEQIKTNMLNINNNLNNEVTTYSSELLNENTEINKQPVKIKKL